MPGVHAVLTHADVPGEKRYGLEFRDQPVLAIDRVRYFGEPVALVAAEHPEQARRAAEQDPRRVRAARAGRPTWSARPSGAELHPDRPTAGPRLPRRPAAERRPHDRDPPRRSRRRGRGRRRGRLRDRHPGPGVPRPRVRARRPGRRGRRRHLRRDAVAARRPRPDRALPRARRRSRCAIHLAGVGGAFGGREDLSMQIHAALLALHTNRPVKIVYNREESFTGHVHRHPVADLGEHRATRDGRLVARADADPARRRRLRLELDGGRVERRRRSPAARTRSPNALIEATVVYTNNPPCGAMRGFGAVQTCFAARGADGQARRRARHRPGRAAAAERARARRRAADRPADRRARCRPPR